MTSTVIRWTVNVVDIGVRSLDIPFGIYGEKSGTRTSVSPSTSPSSVSIIPPVLYTHMFDSTHSFKLAASKDNTLKKRAIVIQGIDNRLPGIRNSEIPVPALPIEYKPFLR